jgi:hypothetical protein
MAHAKGGLTFSELTLGGKTGYLRLTMTFSWRRLAGVCVLMKLGVTSYLVFLDGIAGSTQGNVFLCNGSTTPNYIRWRAVGTGEDRLIFETFTSSARTALAPSSFYTGSSTPTPNLDENNVTMLMGSHGSVAISNDGLRQPSAYMVFMNETISAMLQEQGSTTLSSGVMSSADNNFIVVDGAYGVFTMPVVPAVSSANVFIMFIQPEGYISKDDSLVLRIRSKYQDASSTGIQISVGANGTTLEVINVTQRSSLASRQFYTSQCVLVRTLADITRQFAIDGSRFYCRPFPLSITSWTRISLVKDPTQANLMTIYMDSEVVARGRHDGITALFTDVGTIQLTLRNRFQVFSSPIQVREIAFCLDSIGIGVTDGPNPFPCAVGTKVLNRYHISTSESISNTFSQSSEPSVTKSYSDTQQQSVSRSSSVSETEMRTSSWSLSQTQEVSGSVSFTSETTSNTVNVTSTHSKSHTIQKNVSVVAVNLNSASISAYNIRKTGVPILLFLEQDEFNPRQDWMDSPNAYMHCTSSLTSTANPSGFCASFVKKSFATGFLAPSNRSLLQITFGPAIFYNSYADEAVSLSFLSSGAASEFRVSGSINFTVAGVGYRITTALRQIEAAGALFALASLGLGGPSSNVMRIATNSIFLNFHCFNDEDYPLSWLVSPTNTEVKGSEKIGVAVVTFSLMLGIVGVHLALVMFVYFQKRDTFLKAQGDVYFPGLTIGVCVILLPGYISGAWQGAVQSDISGYIVLVVVTTAIVVSIPLLFLIRTLYDTAYFTASFAPFDREVWASFIMKYPVMARVIPSGVWHSTDRHYSFVRRFHHIIWEYRDTMQHWFCIEFAEGVVVGSVGALTNSNPVVCMAQLACFITIKICIFIALVKLRPHGTLFGQWPATLISLMQLVSLIFVLIDASKGGTNAYQQAYTVMLFVIAMILTVHSLITCGVLIRYRYLKHRERKLMHAVAEIYADQHHDDEAYTDEVPANTQEARLAAASHKYPSMVKYLPEGTMVKVVDIPIKLLLEDDVAVEEEMVRLDNITTNPGDIKLTAADSGSTAGSVSDMSPHDQVGITAVGIQPSASQSADRVPMTLVDRMAEINSVNEPGLQSSKKQYRTAESRNFWRVAAMESLTGAPVTDIPYDPDAEFL